MNMPQGNEPGQPRDPGQQAGPPGQQPGTPPSYGDNPYGQDEYGQNQYGAQNQYGQNQYGAPQYGGAPGYAPPGQPGGGPMMGMVSPVAEVETRVTGRRVVQYIIDYVITGAIGSLIMWIFDRSNGALNAVLLLIGALIVAAWYFWYWVLRPRQAGGQTFGMQLLGLRIISKDGGPAGLGQLFVRAILLIVDTLFWGLVGFITIIASRYRQRVGDHAARTLVVRASVVPLPAQREYARAGHAPSR
jgi:uncharacterized RDD family membrane protein YckC